MANCLLKITRVKCCIVADAAGGPIVPRTFDRVAVTYLIFLNSSQSHRIRFMCLSKALKVPMKIRPSWRMHLILKSMCCSILLLLPTVCGQIRDGY